MNNYCTLCAEPAKMLSIKNQSLNTRLPMVKSQITHWRKVFLGIKLQEMTKSSGKRQIRKTHDINYSAEGKK